MKNRTLLSLKSFITVAVLSLISMSAFSQVSGVKTIPTDYASIDAFIIDINTNGIGAGGVTLNVPSGHTETAPNAGLVITASGTAANPIIINGQGPTFPIITASPTLTAGALNNAVILIHGGDYITVQNLVIRENAANTITAAGTNNMTEWGIALLYATNTDSPQNCSILNNDIQLGSTYQNAFGIYANATHSLATPTSTATATGAFGGMHNLTISGNTITSVNNPISIAGPVAAADQSTGLLISANNITGYGLTGTISSYPNVSGSVNGIYVKNNKIFQINNNSITANGTNTAGTIRGIYIPTANSTPTGTFANTIQQNTISITNGANTAIYGVHVESGTLSTSSELNILNNTFTGLRHSGAVPTPSSLIAYIYNSCVTAKNTFQNNSFGTIGACATSAELDLIYNSNTSAVNIISGNYTVGTITKTGSGSNFYGYYNNGSPSGGKTVFSNNNFSNITISGSTAFFGTYFNTTTSHVDSVYNNTVSNILTAPGASGNVIGIYQSYGNTGSAVFNNDVFNINGGTGTTAGIRVGFSSSTGISVYNNRIRNISTQGNPDMHGLWVSGSSNGRIFGNKIYGLTKNGVAGYVAGITVSGGANVQVYNNLISDLNTPNANFGDAIRAINISSTSTNSNYGVYNNTVMINASSTGADFGTTALYHAANATSTTSSLDLRGNILINLSTPNGTAYTSAYRRSGTALANYASTSNNNLFYAGVPAANRVILTDGTALQQTLANYQTLVSARDLQSITGEAFSYATPGSFFMSLTGSSSDFLRPVAGLTTQTESAVTPITTPITVSTDFDGTVRATFGGYAGTGTKPDMGAYEFEGITPAPVITLNSVTPPTTIQCTASNRLVSVNITTAAGSILSANIGYTMNGVPQAPISMTNTSGNTWEGIIPAAVPGNATIVWGVSSTNSLGISSTLAGTTYTDEPLLGSTASANSTGPICPSANSTLTALLAKNGSITLGSGSSTSTSAASNPTYGIYGGVKTQYILLASELSAQGLVAGNITSLGFTITSPGVNLAGFALSAQLTSLTSLTTNIIDVTNTVYNTASFVPALGLNNLNFSTPLFWDGTSNIILSFCWSNNNTSNTPSTVLVHNPGFTSSNARYADNRTPAEICSYTGTANPAGWTTGSTTTGTRPIFVIAGNTNTPIASISWMDGATSVGTTNPLVVTPSVTTTYTANIVYQGCTVTPAPTTTVTVNPAPTAPTASNSVQCGTQTPTASVSSTSGLGTPEFIWYTAPTAGTVLQSGTSNMFNSAVSTTTTFYVSEINSATGCESGRVPVTVTVNSADNIAAATSAATICLGSSVTLSASNLNPTPVQSYSYSWISTSGSGNETTTNGTTIIVTPTAAGNYTYDLSAVDGSCAAASSVMITVNPDQALPLVSASSSAICVGASISLNAGISNPPVTLFTQNFDSGIGSWTTQYSGTAPATTGWTLQNPPYSYTTYFSNFATPQGGGFMITNSDMGGSGLKTRSKLTSPSFSTLGLASATLNFQNLYRRWATGDSLVAVEISINGGTTWVALKTYTASQGVTTDFAQVPANESILLGAPYLNQADVRIRFNYVSTWGYYWVVDDIILTGTNAITYAWSSNPSGFSSSTPNPTGITPAVTTDYTLMVTNSYGCSNSAMTTVTVNALPTVDAGLDQIVCDGNSVTLSGSGAVSYLWNNGVTNNTAFTPASSNTYTVSGTDANGCVNTDDLTVTVNTLPTVDAGLAQEVCDGSGTQVTLSGSGALTYTWDNGITDNVAFTPLTTQTYTVTGTDANGCQDTDDVLVTVNALPTVDAGLDQEICEGASVILAGSGAVSYSWDNGVIDNTTFTPLATNIYTVTGTDANGCQDTDDVLVTVNVLPTIDAGLDQEICEGASVVLAGSGAVSYSWDNGATDNVAFTPSATTTFTVTGTDANGCQNTDDLEIIVNTLPTVDAGIDQSVCDGASVTLAGSGTVSYSWDNGISDNTAFTPVSTNTYTVTGTDANGCQNTDDVVVTVNSLPTINAGNDVTVCEGSSVSLSASGAVSYTWDNGITNNTPFTALATTTYEVTGTDANGCENTDDVTVTVNTNPIATAVDNGNGTISAGAATSYEWIDCSTNLAVPGANAQNFAPAQNGSYAVVITNTAGCSDTSDCVVINYLKVVDLTNEFVTVYPNPTTGIVTVVTSTTSAKIAIMDASGKLVLQLTIDSGDQVSLNEFETGVYIFTVETSNGISTHRIVKQ